MSATRERSGFNERLLQILKDSADSQESIEAEIIEKLNADQAQLRERARAERLRLDSKSRRYNL